MSQIMAENIKVAAVWSAYSGTSSSKACLTWGLLHCSAPLDLVPLVRRMVEQLPRQADWERIELELVEHLPRVGVET